ncbi:aldehyde dehydrogenase family protein [Streptomyces chartreusis]|uniref:aldehyde dehydrogenase family protein n=1 Tax=Streptomyces chartreusis TaxID=1969 RepID=UPI0036F89482
MTALITGVPEDARNADGSWRCHIDGVWRDTQDGRRLEVVNPANGAVVATVAAAGPADVEDAVRAACRAFESGAWRTKTPQSRASALLRLAQRIRNHAEDLALAESLGNGMPFGDARAMVKRCATSLEYASGMAQRAYGQSIPVASRYLDFTVREPIGVCALVVPWNGPLLSAVWKLGPAIVLGNSVVLKPSELTPLTALMLAHLCADAGIPPGVVNVLAGGPDVGAELVGHPGIHKIAFTGSTATGKAIMKTAAEHVKRVTLELGGKAPNIFFDDLDMTEAVAGAVSGLMRNTGQTCIAGARILVQQSRYEEFVQRALEAIGRLRVGDGLDVTTQLGPIVSPAQLDKVQDFVASARKDGAEVHGGQLLEQDSYAGGNFMAPGIITGATSTMRVSQEEVFGPLGVVIPFENEEEAVALANDTPYGLAAGIWTRDIKRALRVTRGIRAGTVWINTYGWNFVEAPMGGFKESGLGRENGDAVIDAYTETKNVVVELQDHDSLDIYRVGRRS